MDFSTMYPFLAPQAGIDPFALGSVISQNPEAATGALATLGPPPAQGQGFMDWLGSKLGGPPTQPGVTGEMPGQPSPLLVKAGMLPTPGAPPGPAGNAMGTPGLSDMGVAPQYGAPSPVAPPPPVPLPQSRPNLAGITADEAQRRTLVPPTVGSPLDITSDAQKAGGASEAAPGMTPAQRAQGIGKGLQDALRGIAAPKQPESNVPRAPAASLPHVSAMPQGSPLAALIQSLVQGGAGGANPNLLRLSQALGAR